MPNKKYVHCELASRIHDVSSNVPIAGQNATSQVYADGVNNFIIWILDLPLFFGTMEMKYNCNFEFFYYLDFGSAIVLWQNGNKIELYF